jgi:hypothetical protein
LRAVSKSLAAIFSRSCILSPLHFAVQNATDSGKRCLFGIRLKASSASAPCGGRDRPAHLKPADQTCTSVISRRLTERHRGLALSIARDRYQPHAPRKCRRSPDQENLLQYPTSNWPYFPAQNSSFSN